MGRGACIVALSVLHQGQPDSGESCNVLQSRPTCSPIAKLLQRSVVACSMQTLCCRLQMRPQTSVCKPDVVVPKVHQKNHSYVRSADLPSDSLRKDLAW